MTVKYDGTTGDDQHTGVANDENLMFGLAGDDRLIGGGLDDDINGGQGNDHIDGGSGADILDGADGDDDLNGGDGADLMYSGTGDDYMDGGAGDDQMSTEEGLVGDHKNLVGGSGDDWFALGNGFDQINGGIGEDLVDYRSFSSTGITVNLQTGIGSGGAAEGDTYKSIEMVLGTQFNDTLIGNGKFNTLYGNDGNDTIRGGAGGDEMHGGDGRDTLDYTTSDLGVTINLSTGAASGGDAQGDEFDGFENVQGSDAGDTLTGDDGTNLIDGGNGNDVIQGGDGNDFLIGGLGVDTLSYAASAYGVVVDLTVGYGNGDFFAGFENVIGSNFNDILTGDAGNNTLTGGFGNDMLIGGAGADTLIGGADTDTASYATATKGVVASLADASHNTGDAKGDTYSGIEFLTGSDFADKLGGDGAANALMGGAGNDTLTGGAGADKLYGGADIDTASYATAKAGVTASLANDITGAGDAKGDYFSFIENLTGSNFADSLTGDAGKNVIMAGGGNDILVGGAGADRLYGGAGSDTFVFKAIGDTTVATAGQDTIFDFSHVQGDKVSLSGIDANTALAGDQAFVFLGSAAFTGAAGQLHVEKQAADTYLYGDTNGDKVADFVIHFDQALTFQAGDFVL